MLSILANWLYMAGIIFIMGIALMQGYFLILGKVNKEKRDVEFGFTHVMFAGIMGTTFYAQIFSIFYRVNIEANIVLLILMVVYAVWQQKYIGKCIRTWKAAYAFMGKWKYLLHAVIYVAIIAFALCSAGPAKLVDTDWYHAQTIRWIEECGCVTGNANVFYNLGFNNAQHYFDALFSMKWMTGQSLRGTGGFFGMVIFIHGLLRLCHVKNHTRHMADMLAVWEVAYSIIVTAFFADPYVDTLPNVLVLFILTEWFALLEDKKEDTVWYGFYCLLAVFATVCKTSAAMIVLLTAYPVYLLIKQKKALQIPVYLGIGFICALPYLITNVLTSGYPLFLVSSVDLFKVPWKLDKAVVDYCVDNMVAFARMPGATVEEAMNCGLAWVPGWFAAESISHQILYIAIAIFVVWDLLTTLVRLIKREDVDIWMLWPRVCVYLGLVYWFFTIPQVKYCWAFLIFPVAVIPTYYLEKKKGFVAKGMMLLSVMLLLMYSGFYSLRTLGYMKDGLLNYPVMQADYQKYVHKEVEKNGHTFYVRYEDGDSLCGYYVFPYLDNKDILDELVVGDTLRGGFYLETKDERTEK